jgi:hypothetical protein
MKTDMQGVISERCYDPMYVKENQNVLFLLGHLSNFITYPKW